MTTVNQANVTNFKKRDFILDGKVSEETMKKIVESILSLNRQDKDKALEDSAYEPEPIKVIINTYGGSLYDANMLISVIEYSETPVHTYVYGKAMSAGFYIFSAGHRRFASPLATFMYHDASVGLHNTIEGLKVDLEHLIELRDRYDAYMLSVTNLPKHIMDEKKKLKEDWYLDAYEAQGYGLVDVVLPFRKR